jgi:hypothetical protein
VKMISLGAIFIIELLYGGIHMIKKHDYIVSKPWLKCGIRHDLKPTQRIKVVWYLAVVPHPEITLSNKQNVVVTNITG